MGSCVTSLALAALVKVNGVAVKNLRQVLGLVDGCQELEGR